MGWTIIVASGDPDQLGELADCAKKIMDLMNPADDGRIFTALSVEDVEILHGRVAEQEKELLIIEADLPSQRSRGQGGAGFDLLKKLQEKDSPPAAILVSIHSEHALDVQHLKRSEVILVGASTDYVGLATKRAYALGVTSSTSFLKPQPNTPMPVQVQVESPKRYALIEVDVRKDMKHSMVRLQINDPERRQEEAEWLDLNEAEVTDFLKESRRFRENLSNAFAETPRSRTFRDRWHFHYTSLGQRAHKMLWRDPFDKYYLRAQARVGPNIRVRFNLDPSVYDGLWESLRDQGNERFLMIGDSLARRVAREQLPVDEPRPEIGGRGATLNVLAVGSDVSRNSVPEGPEDVGWKNYWADGALLRNLPHVEKEIEMLMELNNPAIKVKPLKFRGGVKPSSLADKLERELKEHPRLYDVLHFAGHALFAPGKRGKDSRGYLVFSGSPRPRAVTIAEVASWLAGTSVQLVYLSCCRSSAAKAAIELANIGVPMTIGFNWDLDDVKAVDFAKEFYEALLESQLQVCTAFRKARLTLHNRHEVYDGIWASPVLVAQPRNWPQQVEDVLCPPVRRASKSQQGF
ncbi:CHAT domain-containing protein [Mesorhizobium sp. ASY16-5R]|uniref:CHAT domain-containing protein n=1 Tax=Mesorhizobium sp. ASY16-5R TaxID=3445772 RepID=UPI003FA037CB